MQMEVSLTVELTSSSHVFSAIKFLHEQKFKHGHISATSIRVCGRTGRVLLGKSTQSSSRPEFANWSKGNLDRCVSLEGGPTNEDLEGLGLVLLNCMEEGDRRVRTAQQVRDERATNKVFGLANAERWSGCKRLIDFLDDLFSGSRKPEAKFGRPVCTTRSRGEVFGLLKP
jgi:hypothetical protein